MKVNRAGRVHDDGLTEPGFVKFCAHHPFGGGGAADVAHADEENAHQDGGGVME